MYTGMHENVHIYVNKELIKFFHRKFHRFFHRIIVFCEKFIGVPFFVKKFTGWRMIHILFRARTRKIAPARQWIMFCLKRKTRFLRNIHTMTTYLKHVEIIKFRATTKCDMSLDRPLKV